MKLTVLEGKKVKVCLIGSNVVGGLLVSSDDEQLVLVQTGWDATPGSSRTIYVNMVHVTHVYSIEDKL